MTDPSRPRVVAITPTVEIHVTDAVPGLAPQVFLFQKVGRSKLCRVPFQEGDPIERGVNGITNAHLLMVLRERYRGERYDDETKAAAQALVDRLMKIEVEASPHHVPPSAPEAADPAAEGQVGPPGGV